MKIRIGIMTVRDATYHPNRRLLEAIHAANHKGLLIHPYRFWPEMNKGHLRITSLKNASPPHVLLPRQGATIGSSSMNLIRQFQLIGIPAINGFDAIAISRNKFLAQQVLISSGLPCLDTLFVNSAEGLFHAVDRLGGYPVVVKSESGRQGETVQLVQNREQVHQQIVPGLAPRNGLMIQRYLPPQKRRDFRALVVGGRCVAAMELTPVDGEFRANYHLGAACRAANLSVELQRLAIEATAAAHCDVAGVDLMVDAKHRPVIVEINYSPGFKGLEKATGQNIAREIVQLAIDRFHEGGK